MNINNPLSGPKLPSYISDPVLVDNSINERPDTGAAVDANRESDLKRIADCISTMVKGSIRTFAEQIHEAAVALPQSDSAARAHLVAEVECLAQLQQFKKDEFTKLSLESRPIGFSFAAPIVGDDGRDRGVIEVTKGEGGEYRVYHIAQDNRGKLIRTCYIRKGQIDRDPCPCLESALRKLCMHLRKGTEDNVGYLGGPETNPDNFLRSDMVDDPLIGRLDQFQRDVDPCEVAMRDLLCFSGLLASEGRCALRETSLTALWNRIDARYTELVEISQTMNDGADIRDSQLAEACQGLLAAIQIYETGNDRLVDMSDKEEVMWHSERREYIIAMKKFLRAHTKIEAESLPVETAQSDSEIHAKKTVIADAQDFYEAQNQRNKTALSPLTFRPNLDCTKPPKDAQELISRLEALNSYPSPPLLLATKDTMSHPVDRNYLYQFKQVVRSLPMPNDDFWKTMSENESCAIFDLLRGAEKRLPAVQTSNYCLSQPDTGESGLKPGLVYCRSWSSSDNENTILFNEWMDLYPLYHYTAKVRFITFTLACNISDQRANTDSYEEAFDIIEKLSVDKAARAERLLDLQGVPKGDEAREKYARTKEDILPLLMEEYNNTLRGFLYNDIGATDKTHRCYSEDYEEFLEGELNTLIPPEDLQLQNQLVDYINAEKKRKPNAPLWGVVLKEDCTEEWHSDKLGQFFVDGGNTGDDRAEGREKYFHREADGKTYVYGMPRAKPNTCLPLRKRIETPYRSIAALCPKPKKKISKPGFNGGSENHCICHAHQNREEIEKNERKRILEDYSANFPWGTGNKEIDAALGLRETDAYRIGQLLSGGAISAPELLQFMSNNTELLSKFSLHAAIEDDPYHHPTSTDKPWDAFNNETFMMLLIEYALFRRQDDRQDGEYNSLQADLKARPETIFTLLDGFLQKSLEQFLYNPPKAGVQLAPLCYTLHIVSKVQRAYIQLQGEAKGGLDEKFSVDRRLALIKSLRERLDNGEIPEGKDSRLFLELAFNECMLEKLHGSADPKEVNFDINDLVQMVKNSTLLFPQKSMMYIPNTYREAVGSSLPQFEAYWITNKEMARKVAKMICKAVTNASGDGMQRASSPRGGKSSSTQFLFIDGANTACVDLLTGLIMKDGQRVTPSPGVVDNEYARRLVPGGRVISTLGNQSVLETGDHKTQISLTFDGQMFPRAFRIYKDSENDDVGLYHIFAEQILGEYHELNVDKIDMPVVLPKWLAGQGYSVWVDETGKIYVFSQRDPSLLLYEMDLERGLLEDKQRPGEYISLVSNAEHRDREIAPAFSDREWQQRVFDKAGNLIAIRFPVYQQTNGGMVELRRDFQNNCWRLPLPDQHWKLQKLEASGMKFINDQDPTRTLTIGYDTEQIVDIYCFEGEDSHHGQFARYGDCLKPAVPLIGLFQVTKVYGREKLDPITFERMDVSENRPYANDLAGILHLAKEAMADDPAVAIGYLQGCRRPYTTISDAEVARLVDIITAFPKKGKPQMASVCMHAMALLFEYLPVTDRRYEMLMYRLTCLGKGSGGVGPGPAFGAVFKAYCSGKKNGQAIPLPLVQEQALLSRITNYARELDERNRSPEVQQALANVKKADSDWKKKQNLFSESRDDRLWRENQAFYDQRGGDLSSFERGRYEQYQQEVEHAKKAYETALGMLPKDAAGVVQDLAFIRQELDRITGEIDQRIAAMRMQEKKQPKDASGAVAGPFKNAAVEDGLARAIGTDVVKIFGISDVNFAAVPSLEAYRKHAKTQLELDRYCQLSDSEEDRAISAQYEADLKQFKGELQEAAAVELMIQSQLKTYPVPSSDKVRSAIDHLKHQKAAMEEAAAVFRQNVQNLLGPLPFNDAIRAYLKMDRNGLPDISRARAFLAERLQQATGQPAAPQAIKIEEILKQTELFMLKAAGASHAQHEIDQLNEVIKPENEKEKDQLWLGALASIRQAAVSSTSSGRFACDLVYRYISGYYPRPEQSVAITQLCQALQNGQGDAGFLVKQLLMGSGKTKYILPLLLLLTANIPYNDRANIPVIVSHRSQMATVKADFMATLKDKFEMELVTVELSYLEMQQQRQLEDLKRNLQGAILERKSAILIESGTLEALYATFNQLSNANPLTPEAAEKLKIIAEIFSLLRERGIGFFDEVDKTLSPRESFITPNAQAAKEHLSERNVQTVARAMQLIENSKQFGEFLRKGQLRNMSATDRDALLKMVADDVVHNLTAYNIVGLDGKQFIDPRNPSGTEEEQEASFEDHLSRYLLGQSDELVSVNATDGSWVAKSPEGETDAAFLNFLDQAGLGENSRAALYLMRGLLTNYFPRTFTQSFNENFGYGPDGTCVPFKGPNEPSTNVFKDPFETLCYNFLCVAMDGDRGGGIHPHSVGSCVERLYRAALRPGKGSGFGEDSILRARFDALFGDAGIHFEDCVPPGSDAADATIEKWNGQIERLTAHLNSNADRRWKFAAINAQDTIEYNAETFEGKSTPLPRLFSCALAFSGTVANVDAYHQALSSNDDRRVADAGAIGRIFNKIRGDVAQGNCQIRHVKGDVLTFQDLAEQIEGADKQFSAVIDAGAFMKHSPARKVASDMLAAQPDLNGVVYFDPDAKGFFYLSKKKSDAVALTSTNIKDMVQSGLLTEEEAKQYAVYFDQPRTTGTDFQFRPDAHFWVTVDPAKTTIETFAQAVFRARQILTNQTIDIVVLDSGLEGLVQPADGPASTAVDGDADGAIEGRLAEFDRLVATLQRNSTREIVQQKLQGTQDKLHNLVQEFLFNLRLQWLDQAGNPGAAKPAEYMAFVAQMEDFLITRDNFNPSVLFNGVQTWQEARDVMEKYWQGEKSKLEAILASLAGRAVLSAVKRDADSEIKRLDMEAKGILDRTPQVQVKTRLSADGKSEALAGSAKEVHVEQQQEQQQEQEREEERDQQQEQMVQQQRMLFDVGMKGEERQETDWITGIGSPTPFLSFVTSQHADQISSLREVIESGTVWDKKRQGNFRKYSDFGKCFPDYVRVTENFRLTSTDRDPSVFGSLQKDAEQMLIVWDENYEQKQVIFVSKKEAVDLRREIEAGNLTHCYLCLKNGTPLTKRPDGGADPLPQEMRDFHERAVWWAHFFDADLKCDALYSNDMLAEELLNLDVSAPDSPRAKGEDNEEFKRRIEFLKLRAQDTKNALMTIRNNPLLATGVASGDEFIRRQLKYGLFDFSPASVAQLLDDNPAWTTDQDFVGFMKTALFNGLIQEDTLTMLKSRPDTECLPIEKARRVLASRPTPAKTVPTAPIAEVKTAPKRMGIWSWIVGFAKAAIIATGLLLAATAVGAAIYLALALPPLGLFLGITLPVLVAEGVAVALFMLLKSYAHRKSQLDLLRNPEIR